MSDHFLLVMGGVGVENTPRAAAFNQAYKNALAWNCAFFTLHATNDLRSLGSWPSVADIFYRRPREASRLRTALNGFGNIFSDMKIKSLSRQCGIAYDTPLASLFGSVAEIDRKAMSGSSPDVPPVKGLVVFTIGDRELTQQISEDDVASIKAAGTRTVIVACPTGEQSGSVSAARLELCQHFAQRVGGVCVTLPATSKRAITEVATLAALSMILPAPSLTCCFPPVSTSEGVAFQNQIAATLTP